MSIALALSLEELHTSGKFPQAQKSNQATDSRLKRSKTPFSQRQIGSLFLAEHSEIEKRLFLCGRIAPVQGTGLPRLFKLHVSKFSSLFILIVFSSVCVF